MRPSNVAYKPSSNSTPPTAPNRQNAPKSGHCDTADGLPRRTAIFLYGVIAYVCFLAVFLYAVPFIGGFWAPTTLDGPRVGSFWTALGVNVLLLAVFALQHSVMARPAFKRWWMRIIPRQAERSTYVLATCIALGLIFWLWRPMGGVIWHVEQPAGRAALWTLFGLGWAIVLWTTFLINHFDLFGLRQVWLYLRGRPYTPLRFVTPGPYRYVRHPLYVGWLLAFWATPTMTAAHLVFALMTTAYILVAIQLEERDLVTHHGASYADYRRRVPMLVPRLRRARGGTAPAAAAQPVAVESAR